MHLAKASVLLNDKQLFYTTANGNILQHVFFKTNPKAVKEFSASL